MSHLVKEDFFTQKEKEDVSLSYFFKRKAALSNSFSLIFSAGKAFM